MVFEDEWEHDPSVQMMRKVFFQMERVQEKLLRDLSVSPFDSRLRDVRRHARDLFGRLWPVATGKGIVVDEEEAASLYVHCLAYVLSQRGIRGTSKGSKENEKVARFFKEHL